MGTQDSSRRFSRLAAVVAATAVAGGMLLTGATAEAAPQSANACSGSHQAGGAPQVWSKASHSGCSVFGSPGRKQGYSFTVTNNQTACVQGWGFDSAHPKGGWFDIGCGVSGHMTVPWGNVLGEPQVRVKSVSILPTLLDWYN
ncbi:hypothetical protein AB0383_25895 [Amycolatopsis sp. NPDC051373]|uniref:hypothetical protein n=1 Tax=Amycolatopsis sp. NPDC051373 TaxID=3155801 RepID=UPI00344CBEE3